jgi:Lon protease-like protein
VARLPLFPLGTVHFPGLVLPLHVFEPRYRALVDDLRVLPEEAREFGVVAIRAGHEVGADAVGALHEVGCSTLIRRLTMLPDGRSELVTVGERRFRLDAVHHDRPYLVGEVTWLPDDDPAPDADVELLVAAVQARFLAYRTLLTDEDAPELPDDPAALSYLLAASMLLEQVDRQRLLAVDRADDRLRRLLRLLHREALLVGTLRAVPAPDLARVAGSLN